MGDWSGEIYVYESGGRGLFRGTTTVRQDGSQGNFEAKMAVPKARDNDQGWTAFDNYREPCYEEVMNQYKEGSQPKKLFQLALTYVACHIHNVDSLVGFPEDVGYQLFEEGFKLGRFKTPEQCVEPFYVFSLAYESLFVSCISLDKLKLSSAICEVITKACADVLKEVHLKDMIIESNGLLQALLQGLGQMTPLQKISLINCNLKDSDLRLFSANSRLHKRGPINLQEMDLSANYNISGISVRYLKIFEKLQLLNMTGSSIESNCGVEHLKNLGLQLASTDQVSRLLEIQKGTYGCSKNEFYNFGAPWAEKVFNEWQKTQPDPEKNDEKSRFKFSTFYNASKEKAKEARLKNALTIPLVFIKRTFHKDNKSKTPENKTSMKRKRSLVDADHVLDALFSKENVNVNYDESDCDLFQEDADSNFLSQYATKMEDKKVTKKQKTSLFELL